MSARACVAAVALAALVATPGVIAAPKPALRLVRSHPVTVHGTGFRSHERIRVVLHEPSGVYRRPARASASGAFSTTFASASIGRCESFSITATGHSGRRASVGRRAPVGCPP